MFETPKNPAENMTVRKSLWLSIAFLLLFAPASRPTIETT